MPASFWSAWKKTGCRSNRRAVAAIAIEQRRPVTTRAPTLGTVTEIYDYLRLIYARVGTPHCFRCGLPISGRPSTDGRPGGIAAGRRAPDHYGPARRRGKKAATKNALSKLKKRALPGCVSTVSCVKSMILAGLDPAKPHTIEVVIDRLVVKDAIRNRLADSLELALAQGDGSVLIDVADAPPLSFRDRAVCTACGIGYPEFTPASFSFNSPQGACPACGGLGVTSDFDPALIVPDPRMSLKQGAVAPWAQRSSGQFMEFLEALTTHYHTSIYTPFEDLPADFKNILLYGSRDEPIIYHVDADRPVSGSASRSMASCRIWSAVIGKPTPRSPGRHQRFMNFRPCSECRGAKLNPVSRAVKLGPLTISELCA